MPSDSPLDYIDYTSLQFPSDRLTLLDVRRAHPERFDVEGAERFADPDGVDHLPLNTLLYMERLVARAAFEVALGKSADLYAERGLVREECLEEMAEMYQMYGLSTGPQHTEQMIRTLESQAAAQAGRRR